MGFMRPRRGQMYSGPPHAFIVGRVEPASQ